MMSLKDRTGGFRIDQKGLQDLAEEHLGEYRAAGLFDQGCDAARLIYEAVNHNVPDLIVALFERNLATEADLNRYRDEKNQTAAMLAEKKDSIDIAELFYDIRYALKQEARPAEP